MEANQIQYFESEKRNYGKKSIQEKTRLQKYQPDAVYSDENG